MKVEIGMVSGKTIITDLYQFETLIDMQIHIANSNGIMDAKNNRVIINKNIEYIEVK